jgi:catechol 2,3-dioxygenase-like lactoylglutathione lyase family enzyme
MLSNARVVPTLAVSDMERARHFYEEGLGLAVEADVVGTVRYSCGGDTALAIFERPMEPVDRTVAAFELEDIEGEVTELRGRGVEVDDIITMSNGVKRAFFHDPDGNVIGMRQLPGGATGRESALDDG